jgi:hypothetical protein
MRETNRNQRLVYVKAADLDRWECRPIEAIEVLDLKDRPFGNLDGIVIERETNRPIYIAIGRTADDDRPERFLVPVGDVWFDETQRVVRIDAPRKDRIPFDPDEFERMSPQQADEYERRVLATCCPEVEFHRDSRPDYTSDKLFSWPRWLRPSLYEEQSRRT